jgi:hypothetical protein
MKNKPLIILLLFVVSLIWGNIIYKFIKNIGNEDTDWLNNEIAIQNLKIPSAKELDFQLILNYDDPFLVARKKNNTNKNKEEIAFDKAFEEEINPRSISSVNQGVEIRNRFNQNDKHSAITSNRVRPFKWPKISYHGVVKRTDNKNSGLLMVKFNDKLINIRQGEYFMGDFKITKCWRDSIQIINERFETKTFCR